MKRLIIILGILLMVAAIAGVAFTLLNRSMVTTEEGKDVDPIYDPFGSVTVVETPEGKVPLELTDGTQIFVDEFVPEEQPEWAGDTGYQLLGSESEAYHVIYIPADDFGAPASFIVSIIQEPMGANRIAAESALRSLLKIANAQMCALDIQVVVSVSLSEAYAGRNLGLSFCPNSVRLP